jgi:hypothetical protein
MNQLAADVRGVQAQGDDLPLLRGCGSAKNQQEDWRYRFW